MGDIDPRLGADGLEDSHSRISGVCVHHGNGTIKGGCPRGKVFKHISVIQTIGVAEDGFFACSGGQIKRGGVLWYAINVAVMREINIKG